MTNHDTVAYASGLACVMFGPIIVRAFTDNPANRLVVSLLVAGMMVATVLALVRRH